MVEPNYRNKNRGYQQLRVWQDAVSLYVLASRMLTRFPPDLKKVASNTIDAAHSISRNIAEGYCRRSIREYLNHLNIALGSCGEFHSSCEAFLAAGQLGKEEYEEIDTLHYKVENGLLSLIRSLQRKERTGEWEDRFEGE